MCRRPLFFQMLLSWLNAPDKLHHYTSKRILLSMSPYGGFFYIGKHNSLPLSMGPMLFNAVPKLAKNSISPESFKASLDEFLMTLPDTPPTPGYVTANNNSLLDWTATKSRALPKVPRSFLESIKSNQSNSLLQAWHRDELIIKQ